MTGFPDDAAGPSEEAAEWFVRLQSDAAQEADWAAFETWLTADPANSSAFDAVERLWLELDFAPQIGALPEPAIAVVLPFAVRPKRVTWGVWAATGGIAAALAVGVVMPYLIKPIPAEPLQTIVTAKGERKTVTVDGVTIELSSASTLNYRFGRTHRWAELIQGEAAFSVTHDPRRPFEVAAGDRRITDVGTIFDVARIEHAVRVTVKQGKVAVGSTGTRSDLATPVEAGLQLFHIDGETGSSVKAVDTDAALAWRFGRLVYRDASLEAVVSDLNQYFPTPIRVQDPETGKLRFSGVLVLDAEGAVVDRLQAFMPVAVVWSNGAIWIRNRR